MLNYKVFDVLFPAWKVGNVGSITKKSGGCGDWLIRSLYFNLRLRLNLPR